MSAATQAPQAATTAPVSQPQTAQTNETPGPIERTVLKVIKCIGDFFKRIIECFKNCCKCRLFNRSVSRVNPTATTGNGQPAAPLVPQSQNTL